MRGEVAGGDRSFASRLSRITTPVLLSLTLVLSCAIGLLTPYLTAVILLPIWLWYLFSGRIVEAYRLLAARLFLLAFVILGVCFAISAQQPHDVIYVFNFFMFLMFAPMAAIHAQSAGPANAGRVALLALLGTFIGFSFVAWDAIINKSPRPQAYNLGPIVLSNTVMILGFLSLMGIFAPVARWRGLYVLGPVMAIAATLITGSRGPLLSVPPLLLLSLYFIWRYWANSRGRAIALGLAVVAGIVALGILAQGRSTTLFHIANNIFNGVAVSDETARIRLVLYQAGFAAFQDAPWFGHGWARLMSSVVPYLGPKDLQFARLPQLHNEVLNFAVAAGIVGVSTYVLLILTPLLSTLRTARDTQFPAKLFGILVVLIAYVCGGLTDLMLGFEFHTSFFACISAILLGYCQDIPPAKAG